MSAMTGLEAAGFTVGVTAARRADELAAMLERRGAKVVHAPAVRILPLSDDEQLYAATLDCLAHPPDIAVATTGIGFRGWIEAADGWGLGEQLRAVLAGARILSRGPKATGAVRAAGLKEQWSPDSESSGDIAALLLAEGVAGKRIAVQLHGQPLPEFVDPLRAAGAQVTEIATYRWLPPEDTGPVVRMIGLLLGGQLDAITFTSAPAALTFLQIAAEQGVYEQVVAALEREVAVVCVGPITARALQRAGIATVEPERSRLGALAREVVTQLQRRATRVSRGTRSLEVRGHAVVLDGAVYPLAPGPMAVLRTLATEPGVVQARSVLRTVLPGGADNDDHAVEMAVARLRSALGDPGLVRTVVKRGYQLQV